MFMTDVNDTKIYNLSAGKSLPDWITDRKRKELLRKNVDLRKRIELIQEFDMPGVSTCIKVSPDGQFILACGTYKPRVKCYDVNNLSIKFERCFDADVVAFEVLSDDYSKLVFLQCDRYIEFHAAHGRHYRLRIPRFGRDLSYHLPSTDLFIVGTSSEIYRLNLERGQFLQPYQTEASCINVSEINPEHHLICIGTQEGTIEAWDPRDKRKCSTLDVAMSVENTKIHPAVTALKFKNGLQMGVGTASGHVLVYDIRSSEPLFVKDHLNHIPIKKIEFNKYQNCVCSMDGAMLKIWNENDGKQIAYIESTADLNDFATIPDSGMFFFAQEDVKMLTYYVPKLGPAPRWCSFLDNLTEEIETENVENIYDDYKFLTKIELQELGLEHLEGTNLLRAYMHGYFIDMRLYNKARSANDPFAFEKYRKEKIRQEIEKTRPNRLQITSNLPAVNKEMAIRIIDEKDSKIGKKKKTQNLLEDDRFKIMFENPDFEIDKNTEEYRLLTPVLNRLDKSKEKEIKKRIAIANSVFEEEKRNDRNSSDDDLFSEKDEDSSDDDQAWTKEVKKQYKLIQKEKKNKSSSDEGEGEAKEEEIVEKGPKMFELRPGEEFKVRVKGSRSNVNKTTLGKRLADENNTKVTAIGSIGNRQMTFNMGSTSKDNKKREREMKKHREDRKKLIRNVTSLRLKKIITK